uniref:PKD domain-containing protein n=2 Tax=Caenorhabditis tropicalis TaxID=1561998 RepID=A0A1I7UT49_9PELO
MNQPNIIGQFSHFALARMDSTVHGQIEYFDNYKDATSFLRVMLPDPKWSFPSNSTESNVLQVINNFLGGQCGAKLLILLKRYPNIELSDVTSKLRLHHSYPWVICSLTPSGGRGKRIMYDLTTATNGLFSYKTDELFYEAQDFFGVLLNPYLIYATNPVVSGIGSLRLPSMTVPKSGYYKVIMTIRDHADWTPGNSGILRWVYGFQEGHYLNFTSSHTVQNDISMDYNLGNHVFSMTLDYNYTDTEILQIRVYGTEPIDYWIPYDL